MSWKKEISQIKLREKLAKQQGGSEAVKVQHDKGRLTLRERIDLLLDKDSFDEVLEFRVKILHYEGNDSWVEPTIFEIKETIEKDIKPVESEDCDTCSYVETRIELEN